MSKKNSNVILKNFFREFKDLSKVYLSFKKKLDSIKQKSHVVAVSGGPDSLALVALTKAYSIQNKTKFYYVLINHNIRKNSFSEAKKVKSLLKKNKISLTIISNKKKISRNIQNSARLIRYQFLTSFCKKKKIKHILTAHNLEDQIETFFIRLSRGSGLKGLSSMKDVTTLSNKIILYRPLLDIKKQELVRISKEFFGYYIKDPSNKDNKYLRSRIRSLKKPLKQSGIEYDQILRSINNLASSEIIVEKFFQKKFKETARCFKNKVYLNLEKFKKLDTEIKIRTINLSIKNIKKNYYNPRSKKVINLINKLEIDKNAKSTLAGCVFVREKEKILVKIEKNNVFPMNKL